MKRTGLLVIPALLLLMYSCSLAQNPPGSDSAFKETEYQIATDTQLVAASAYNTIEAEDYHSTSSSTVTSFSTGSGNAIGYIESGDSFTYRDVDFGNGVSSFSISLASEMNSSIEIRLNNTYGTLLGTIADASTGGWDSYQTKSTPLAAISGKQNIVLVCSGPVNMDSFQFTASTSSGSSLLNAFSTLQAEDFDSTSSFTLETFNTSDGNGAIGYIERGDSITFDSVDFGSGAASFQARVASEMSSSIEVRLNTAYGTLLGTLNDCSTGSWDSFQEKSVNISNVTGTATLVLVFSGPVNLESFSFSREQGNDNGSGVDYSGKKLIALTFDDGPSATTTAQVLDKLQQNNAVASFFLVGSNVNSSKQAVMQRMLNMGCEIHSHSWSHSYMSQMSTWEIQKEMNDTAGAIYQQVGLYPQFFRPPYIDYNNTMFQAIDNPFINGINVEDWDSSVSTQQRINRLLSQAKDGDIVLLHDSEGNWQTVEALDGMIQGLRNQGFALVTVSQLFELKGVNAYQEYKIWSNVNN